MLQTIWTSSQRLLHLMSVSEDMCIPTRTRLTYNNDKPWFTAKLRQLHQAKEDAFPKGDIVLHKQAKYTLEKEIRVAKRNYSGKLRNVRLGKFSSSIRTISTVAPQGCVLSPLLFSLYTNDCTSKDPSVKLLKFADDTTLIGISPDLSPIDNIWHIIKRKIRQRLP